MNPSDSAHTQEVWTLQEVAAYLRCSQRHIQNLTRRGLPHFRLGALIRFNRQEVIDYLRGNARLGRHRDRKVQLEALGD